MGYILNIVHALMQVGLELEVFQTAHLFPCAPKMHRSSNAACALCIDMALM